MKKIIGGKRYDTASAKEIGSWDNGRSHRDFRHCAETLYVKRTGEFFLYGHGGPMSAYAERCGDMFDSGSTIIPMSAEAAREWAEKHLSVEEYEEYFLVEPDEEPTGTTFRKIRAASGLTQKAFSERFRIPERTIASWDTGDRTPPEYVLSMMREILGV